MKRCPACMRDYDDGLLYCLDDGNALFVGPAGNPRQELLEKPTVRARLNEAFPGLGSYDPDDKAGDLNTIAVLPFTDLSHAENGEYFSDGLAEELLNVLSKITGLRVAARTSAFAFRGKQVSVEEIGRALHVRSVLEGSVRIAEERVRISVQLVDATKGYQIWSQVYDRMMVDIFAIQDDIAHSVVGELRDRFFPAKTNGYRRQDISAELSRAVKGRAADPEAQRLMLMGRYLLERLNEADAAKAIGYFGQALDLDPAYALCWAELGRAFYVASNHGWHTLDVLYEKAEQSLQRSLALDPNLGEAYARLGRIRWFRDANFAETQQYLKRALSLAPDNIDVLLSAVPTAWEAGHVETAIAQCRRAVKIDPLSASAWSTTAIANFVAGDMAEAEAAARRALEIAPQRIILHACLGLILLGQGRLDEAIAAASLEPNSGWRSWSLTIIFRADGRNAESDREMEDLISSHGADFSFQIAEVHSVRGELDEAFEWLDRAIELRDPGRLTTNVSPLLKPLHGDPRWSPLLARIGFPKAASQTV